MVWRDLLQHTDIHDSANVLERLSNHTYTQCPQALAYDLFFATHESNEDAVANLQKHELLYQEQLQTANPTTTNGVDKAINATQTTQVKKTLLSKVVFTVKSKGKAFFRRNVSRNEYITTDSVKEGQQRSLSNVKDWDDQDQGVLNPSFDIGIDNPVFEKPNTSDSELHESTYTTFEPCSDSLLPGTEVNLRNCSRSIGMVPEEESPTTRDSTSEGTTTRQVSDRIPTISTSEHYDYVMLKASTCQNGIHVEDRNSLGVTGGTLDYSGSFLSSEPENKPGRTSSTMSKDSGFGTFERNISNNSEITQNPIFE